MSCILVDVTKILEENAAAIIRVVKFTPKMEAA
jgi:hypothetical protein